MKSTLRMLGVVTGGILAIPGGPVSRAAGAVAGGIRFGVYDFLWKDSQVFTSGSLFSVCMFVCWFVCLRLW